VEGTAVPAADQRGRPARGGSRRWVVGVGVGGVLVMFAVLAGLQALTIFPFHPVDEPSHVGYALELSHGRLPTIDTPIPGEDIPRLQRKVQNSLPENRTVWTANHPPLYYVVAALPLRIGAETGHGLGGVRVARLITVAITLAGLVLVALLARELVPDRPELWVGAAGLAALVPALVRTSALVYNDALMFTLATAAMVVIARMLRRGLTTRRLALLAAVAAACALTRTAGLPVAAVAATAAAAAVWIHDRGPTRRRLLRSAGAGAVVAGVVGVAAGWFYVRNAALYGSFTGTAVLLARFHRGARGMVATSLVDPDFWRDQLRRLWDDSAGPMGRNGTTKFWYLTAVPAIGLALAAVRRRWRGRPATPMLFAWLACLGIAALVQVGNASFHSVGGTAHGRYLLPGLAVLAVVAAVGMRGFGVRRAVVPTILLLAGLVVVNVLVWQRYLRLTLRPVAGEDIIVTGLHSAHLTTWVLLPAAVLLLAGLAAQVWSLWTLTRRAPEPAPVPSHPVTQPAYAGS
jgi:hypothetical protein